MYINNTERNIKCKHNTGYIYTLFAPDNSL